MAVNSIISFHTGEREADYITIHTINGQEFRVSPHEIVLMAGFQGHPSYENGARYGVSALHRCMEITSGKTEGDMEKAIATLECAKQVALDLVRDRITRL